MENRYSISSSYHADLHKQLDEICDALRETKTISTILDEEWCETIRSEITNFKTDGVFSSDSALMFFQLKHPLRGVPWFEKAQSLFLNGRIKDLDSDDKLVLAFVGLDPLRVFLPICDERLTALAELPSQTTKIEGKFNQLKKCRFASEFRNHLFELLVLGYFAKENVLADIEPAGTMVDGVINIDNRKILVEVTFTTQEILCDLPGVHSGDMNALVGQVVYKAKKRPLMGASLLLLMEYPLFWFLDLTGLVQMM